MKTEHTWFFKMQNVCLSKLSDMQFASFVLRSTINEEDGWCEKMLFSFRLNGDNVWIFTHGNRKLSKQILCTNLRIWKIRNIFVGLKVGTWRQRETLRYYKNNVPPENNVSSYVTWWRVGKGDRVPPILNVDVELRA